MWAGVTERFKQFNQNLQLTSDQKAEGADHHHGVRSALNRHYYGYSSDSANSFLSGSWGKYTRLRPPRDIDVYFELPVEVYHRLNTNTGNIQSQLLQEVRTVLQATYPQTNIKGDGPVVVVGFNRQSVEVVPAFKTITGSYLICDTKNGGSYKTADPTAEIDHISTKSILYANNVRPLIRMMKTWQSHCSVQMKSFWIELITTDFLQQSRYNDRGFFYYDWLCRDWFEYAILRANTLLFAPGTGEAMYLGDAWKSRAETAHGRAVKACEYEYQDFIDIAGTEWQKIFGTEIPISV